MLGNFGRSSSTRPLEEPLDRVGEGAGARLRCVLQGLINRFKMGHQQKTNKSWQELWPQSAANNWRQKNLRQKWLHKRAAERTCYRKILQQTAAEVKVNNDQKKNMLSKQLLQWRGKISAGKWFHKRGCGKKMLQKKTCGKWLQKWKLSRKNCWANSCSEWAKYLQENGFTKGAAERKCYRKILRQMAAEVKVNNDQKKLLSNQLQWKRKISAGKWFHKRGCRKKIATEKTCGKWLRKWKLSRKNCWGNSCSEWAKYLQQNGFTEKGCGKKMLQKKPAANGCGSENYQEKNCWANSCSEWAKISAGKWLHKRGCGKKML